MRIDYFTTDHPAWQSTPRCLQRILDTPAGDRYLVSVNNTGASMTQLNSPRRGPDPAIHTYRLPPDTLTDAPELSTALSRLGTVARVATPDLWETLVAAILTQHHYGRYPYAQLSHSYGTHIPSPFERPDFEAVPTPDIITELTVTDLARVGVGDAAHTLIAAAHTYQAQSSSWHHHSPGVLIDELRTIPGLHPDTAARAVADHTGDYAYYPHHHPTLRNAAHQAAPTHHWPGTGVGFARYFKRLANGHLSALTALTLAHTDHTQSHDRAPRRTRNGHTP